MEKRVLGKSGPALTTVGFGAWAIGGPWIYGWGAVTSAIVGARNESQVNENVGSAGWKISDADYALIEELHRKHYA
jgi:aryl-alcohol dehydrogenase-like predicted oxidoreductase